MKIVGSNRYRFFSNSIRLRDLSEISRGGGEVETEGGSQLFETAEKVEVHPQKKKEVLYFVKKT